ncbi:dipicolinic acid synthetase subunit A [Aciduricibacillus chroicocephali]|uniref:Dipicolinic acid synthetase subunit A n=1 Tax=Aciduricibacillus chroicocephali TaxID=3054939 RepID=A0ABY9KY78_9BACI|nr:dipicolinic acid synthetase subunit A [Bacillaceae bacterium 44XB]
MKHKIAVIGGDARYLEMIRQLQTNKDIVLIGYDQLDQSYAGAKRTDLKNIDVTEFDAIILPVRGVGKEGELEAVFSEKDIKLPAEWFKQLKSGTLIFSGIAGSTLKEACQSAGVDLITLMDRDDVAIYNSIPTAEGVLIMAMENTDFTIHGSNVTVSGYGRVGKTVARMFKALGAHVTVAARTTAERARINEMGYRSVDFAELPVAASSADLLINTVPAHVIDKGVICELPAHSIILDIASKPGGTDFEYASQRGIKAILAKSLPGVVAPRTSGKILADVIKEVLEEKKKGANI